LHEDRQLDHTPAFQWWEREETVTGMIGDIVGLEVKDLYEVFDKGGRLIEHLEPLLARGCGSWMTEGCLVDPGRGAGHEARHGGGGHGSPAAPTAGPLNEALRRALLRSLCHKLHSLWDRQQGYARASQRLEYARCAAEMIGEMVGLTGKKVYEVFEESGTGCELIEQMEPLLAPVRRSWIAEGVWSPRTAPPSSAATRSSPRPSSKNLTDRDRAE
jgi:hypothetical protein